MQKQHVYTQYVARNRIRCIISNGQPLLPHIVLHIYLLVDHNLWSTLHALHVFPHIVLHIYLLVDHDLWSTLHTLYVATYCCTYDTG